MPELMETENNWVVQVDDDLVPVSDYDFIGAKKNNVIRHWGIDPDGKKWTSHVFYPKKKYSKEKMEKEILRKYDSCPHCRTGMAYQLDPELEELEEGITRPKKKSSDYMKKYKNVLYAGIISSVAIVGSVIALKTWNEYKGRS